MVIVTVYGALHLAAGHPTKKFPVMTDKGEPCTYSADGSPFVVSLLLNSIDAHGDIAAVVNVEQ